MLYPVNGENRYNVVQPNIKMNSGDPAKERKDELCDTGFKINKYL